MTGAHDEWWRGAVFYEIYPRTFADGNGDGVGDLEGVIEHLDYIRELGVDAIWICPFYPSSFVDGGYDVADFRQVAPVMGDLALFDRLVERAHELGLRVVIDLVANHTSSRHPWFVDASSSMSSPRRDWYFWADDPNDWQAALRAGSAWTLDGTTDQYYLHFFLPAQPDLNWRNAEVISAMHDVMRFWLRRGVDGFRIDAAQCLGKEAGLPPRLELGPTPIAAVNDVPYTHEILRGMRTVVEEFGPDKLLLGEIFIDNIDRVLRYVASGHELHLAFDFSLMRSDWSATAIGRIVTDVENSYERLGAWPTWVVGNHDQPRVASRYGSEARARVMAVILLTLRGTPFIYQGDELGLGNSVVPRTRQLDPNGRDGYRSPMPWTPGGHFGWTGRVPRVPFAPDSADRNVDAARSNAASIWTLYQTLLKLRRTEPALRSGSLDMIESDPQVLSYARKMAGSELRVHANFADVPIAIRMLPSERVVLSSSAAQTTADGVLAPDSAVITRV
jgi:alpha-glucosidase